VKRSSELELAKTRYLQTVSWKEEGSGSPTDAAVVASRADQSVVLVGVDEVNLSDLPDPEFGYLSEEEPGAVAEGGRRL
jgi:hypothetical protein